MTAREVLIEFQRIGPIVKVTALDVATTTEVAIQGPAAAGEEALRRAALAKLDYVLARKRGDAKPRR